ncbi:MAG: aminotransferase class I/II-fold pyridoxal phosphate-dependent enzyme [Gemmatimonadetes bacterium]|nr:aminotransferase class I/II-fold pyridoxal phosphate-dependent enzyme [Gemmatimonadota bacterium]
MKQPIFVMERWQSHHENRVDFNLAESGVQPITLAELREIADVDPSGTLLGYGHTDGSPTLRQRIAAMYPGAAPENVVATVGSAEANFLAMWRLVEPGDRVVVLRPTYEQTTGLAAGLGAHVESMWLEAERGWQPAPGAAADAILPGTRVVVVTNPNNPTAQPLSEAAIAEIVAAAERVGAWILSDEVYAGGELAGGPTPSLWGRTDRVLVSASLSKAYGLPGLRLGWLLAPADFREELWARKDYTTIAPSPLSDRLGAAALETAVRATLLERGRTILTQNLAVLEAWADGYPDILRVERPRAGAVAFFRYDLRIGSAELAERVLAEQRVLIVPGDQFGMDRHFRIGYGYTSPPLAPGLERLSRVIEPLAAVRAG